METMDLFSYMREAALQQEAPLAGRMRPRTLEEIVGQEHILGPDKLLSRAIRSDTLSSAIFYGPPGTGKTTLARVISETASAEFVQINAAQSGKKEMEAIVEQAKNLRGMYQKKTILFIDEIHRFHKGQQDFLLPFVEDGTVVLIGATTENPYFEVNRALLSRSSLFELKSLTSEHIKTLLYRAASDQERGMGSFHPELTKEAADFLAQMAQGDARAALNALELGVLTTQPSKEGRVVITLSVAEECIQKRALGYDKNGDQHYDTVSAWIKSMRGSDADAAIYYLARMLYAGEDVRFLARRLMISAAEDVSNADPMALVLASSCAQAVERVGMPEAQIILAQAVSYIACAPKSNSAVLAIQKAMRAVEEEAAGKIPAHLMDAHYSGAKELGRGLEYQYPHNFPNHYVKQQYLPKELEGRKFYEPTKQGYENEMRQRMKRIRGEDDS